MPFVVSAAPEVMSQKETGLLSFPLVVIASVLKKILPPFVPTAAEKDPSTVQRVIVFAVAPPISLMVDVPDVPEAVVLEMVREFPPVFRPSKVTLSAPLRSISGDPAVIDLNG